MDAQVANVLLVGAQHGLGIDRQQAQAIYEQDRRQADRTCSAPTRSPGPSRPRSALRSVLDGLGRYEALAGEAMYLDGQGPGQPGRRRPQRSFSTGRPPTCSRAASCRRAPATPRPLARPGPRLPGPALRRAARRAVGRLAGVVAARHPGRPPGLPGRPVPAAAQPGAGRGRSGRPGAGAAGASGLWPRPGTCGWPRSEAFDSIIALVPGPRGQLTTPTPTRAATWSTRPGPRSTSRRSRASHSSWSGLPGRGIFEYDAGAGPRHRRLPRRSTPTFASAVTSAPSSATSPSPGSGPRRRSALAAYQVYERDDRHIRALNRGGNLQRRHSVRHQLCPRQLQLGFHPVRQRPVRADRVNKHAFNAARSAAGQHGLQGWTGPIPAAAVILMIVLVLGQHPAPAKSR